DLFRKLDNQQKSIDALPDTLEKCMEKVLEEKGVAAGNITRELLRLEIRSMLQDVGLQRAQSIAPAPEDSLSEWLMLMRHIIRKRRVAQIKLTTVLRLVREAESRRTRNLPFTPRKRQKPANERCASNTTERPTAQTSE
ncbi:hypothetical protein PHMEG_00024346, partial [Phytophthora megakarya]